MHFECLPLVLLLLLPLCRCYLSARTKEAKTLSSLSSRAWGVSCSRMIPRFITITRSAFRMVWTRCCGERGGGQSRRTTGEEELLLQPDGFRDLLRPPEEFGGSTHCDGHHRPLGKRGHHHLLQDALLRTQRGRSLHSAYMKTANVLKLLLQRKEVQEREAGRSLRLLLHLSFKEEGGMVMKGDLLSAPSPLITLLFKASSFRGGSVCSERLRVAMAAASPFLHLLRAGH